jgi:hypothetical protein
MTELCVIGVVVAVVGLGVGLIGLLRKRRWGVPLLVASLVVGVASMAGITIEGNRKRRLFQVATDRLRGDESALASANDDSDSVQKSMSDLKDSPGPLSAAPAKRIIRPYRLLPDSFSNRDCIAFTADGKHVASADSKHIYFWDLKTFKQGRTLDLEQPAEGPLPEQMDVLRLLDDGRSAAGYSRDASTGSVYFWDVHSGKLIRALKLSDKEFHALSVSHDGASIVAAPEKWEERQALLFWDAKTGKLLRTVPLENQPQYLDHSRSGDGLLVVYGDLLEIRHPHTGAIVRSIPLAKIMPDESGIEEIADGVLKKRVRMTTRYSLCSAGAMAPNGKTVALVCWGQKSGGDVAQSFYRKFHLILIVHLETATILGQDGEYPYSVDSLTFSPDGKFLAIPWNGVNVKQVVIAGSPEATGPEAPSIELDLTQAHALIRKGELGKHHGKRVAGWSLAPNSTVKEYASLGRNEAGELQMIRTLLCEGQDGLLFALEGDPKEQLAEGLQTSRRLQAAGTVTGQRAFDGKQVPVLKDWTLSVTADAPESPAGDPKGGSRPPR